MKALTKYWFLEGFDLFKKLGMSTMMELCDLLEMVNIDKGEVIRMHNRSPECIYFLKTGTIKIMDLKNNSAKYIVQKGNIFGELSLYH